MAPILKCSAPFHRCCNRLGYAWRKASQELSQQEMEVLEPLGRLLQVLGQHLRPAAGLSPSANLSRMRPELMGIGELLAGLAAPRPRQHQSPHPNELAKPTASREGCGGFHRAGEGLIDEAVLDFPGGFQGEALETLHSPFSMAMDVLRDDGGSDLGSVDMIGLEPVH